MDPTTFVMQTCPYTVIAQECPAGHLHVLGGFISDVAVQPGEENAWVNNATGQVFRKQSDLAFSLN